MDQTLDRNGAGRQARVHDALRVLMMATLIALVVALLWQAPNVFLIAFTGLLLAVFLRAPANWLAKKTPLKPGAHAGRHRLRRPRRALRLAARGAHRRAAGPAISAATGLAHAAPAMARAIRLGAVPPRTGGARGRHAPGAW